MCLAIPVVAASKIQYTVTPNAELDALTVSLCFDSSRQPRFSLADDTVETFIQDGYWLQGSTRRELEWDGRQLNLKAMVGAQCVYYNVDLAGEVTHPWFRQRQSTQEQILIRLGQWYLFPSDDYTDPIEVTFALPTGYQVSAPGRRVHEAAGKVVYQFRNRPRSWDGRIAIGKRMKRTQIQFANSTVNVAILDPVNQEQQVKLLQWVDANLQALTQVYHEMPISDLQLLVVPVGADREAVPWGQVMRGAGDAVHVYIDPFRSSAAFMNNWVLIHELSHLLHPRIKGNGKWLSEGLASYYQNVLRARSKNLTPEQAWQKLHAGFQRGEKGTPPNLTLAQATENMSKNRLFMRVYWSGAAISLMADAQLRQQSQGAQTLDTVLQQFKHCCLPADRAWAPRSFLEKLDQLSKTKLFTQLFDQYAYAQEFPNLNSTYRTLGIKNSDNKATPLQFVPNRNLRDAIMAGSE